MYSIEDNLGSSSDIIKFPSLCRIDQASGAIVTQGSAVVSMEGRGSISVEG